MKKLLLLFILAVSQTILAQSPKPLRVLFLGNSYTYVNDLPKICTDIVKSTGKEIIVDSRTVGGYTFRQHLGDDSSLYKLKLGGWDYVVLQEQSALPSYPEKEIQQRVLPYAHSLDSLAHIYSPKAKTIFYMTWGRRDGDSTRCSVFPVVCTYKGMDSLLALNYTRMAAINHAEISPVGVVWRSIREKKPALELYQADKSHPSPAGSYAAACCFYTILFQKDPSEIKFDFQLKANDAAFIRSVVKSVVYEQLGKWLKQK